MRGMVTGPCMGAPFLLRVAETLMLSIRKEQLDPGHAQQSPHSMQRWPEQLGELFTLRMSTPVHY